MKANPSNMRGRERVAARGLQGDVQRVAERWRVDVDGILGRSRHQHYVLARLELIADWHARGFTAAEIARLLDRDHSSILTQLRRLKGTRS